MKQRHNLLIIFHFIQLLFLLQTSQAPVIQTDGTLLIFLLHFFPSHFSLLQFVVIASTLTSSGLKYDEYIFPNWSNVLGWSVAMSSMMFVPLYAIYKFLSVPGTFKEVSIKTCLSYRVEMTF